MADVIGLDTFVNHFKGYEEHYVLIGGAACSLWLSSRGLSFRSTRDLDVVIVVEGIKNEFYELLWKFITEGQYQSLEKTEKQPQVYRFEKPDATGYPYMIELLTRNLLELPASVHLTPIPMDEDIFSLSAILLDDDYYQFVLDQRKSIQGATTIAADCLIPLKAKAWLDLTKRREEGDETVKTTDIKKHRNDIFRLLIAMPRSDRVSLPTPLQGDLRAFLRSLPADEETWKSIESAVQSTSGTTLPSRSESADLIAQLFEL